MSRISLDDISDGRYVDVECRYIDCQEFTVLLTFFGDKLSCNKTCSCFLTAYSLLAPLHLKNVLHAPGSICNIYGTLSLEGYDIVTGCKSPYSDEIFSKLRSARIRLIDISVLYRVRLSGQSAT